MFSVDEWFPANKGEQNALLSVCSDCQDKAPQEAVDSWLSSGGATHRLVFVHAVSLLFSDFLRPFY